MVTGEGEHRRNVRQRPTGPLSRHDVAEAAFDVSAALIVVLDRAGRIVRFNAACERLTGHREADVTGQLLWPLVLDEPEAARAETLYAGMAPGSPIGTYQNYWMTPQGERRYINWQTTHLLGENGEIDLLVATGVDVTEERLARLALDCLGGEEQSSLPLLDWLTRLAHINTLVLPGVPSAVQARRVFERSLIANLASPEGATSVGFNMRALKGAAATVRERLSQEHWNTILRADEDIFTRCAQLNAQGDYAPQQALRILKDASDHLAAITGAQTDRMTRDDGWRLLSIGRHVERLAFLASALDLSFETTAVDTEGGFEALLGLFDSTITFHGQYQQSRDVAALIDLLVLDRDNPRSLAWVAHTLRGRLAKLAQSPTQDECAMCQKVPGPDTWSLERLCETPSDGPVMPALRGLLQSLQSAAYTVSESISATYFTHSGETKQSVGT